MIAGGSREKRGMRMGRAGRRIASLTGDNRKVRWPWRFGRLTPTTRLPHFAEIRLAPLLGLTENSMHGAIGFPRSREAFGAVAGAGAAAGMDFLWTQLCTCATGGAGGCA